MLGNLPIFQSARRLIHKREYHPTDDLPTFYDLYNEHNQKPWEVQISSYDKQLIELAISKNQSVRISPGLNDVQLLKLHATSFPEYDNQLVYHSMFGMYEVKYNKETIALFSYSEGIYTPIASV